MTARSLAPAWRVSIVVILALLAALPARAAAAALPPQGVYEGCAPGTQASTLQACVDRLRRIHDAGFEIVLNYSGLYGSPEEVRLYAAEAHRLGTA